MLPSIAFSIITKGDKYNSLSEVISSIRNLSIPNCEIYVCGKNNLTKKELSGVQILPYNDEINLDKLGKKKNFCNRIIETDIIVHSHDYLCYDVDWWNGYKRFGFDWDICTNVVIDKSGKRNCDWVRSGFRYASRIDRNVINCSPIDYDDYSQMKYQYVPGLYWLSKKYVIDNDPINEDLSAGEMEDVEWSDRVLVKYEFKMNQYSLTKMLK